MPVLLLAREGLIDYVQSTNPFGSKKDKRKQDKRKKKKDQQPTDVDNKLLNALKTFAS